MKLPKLQTYPLTQPPAALGIVRAAVHGYFLFAILTTAFDALALLPTTILRPTGIMQWVSWEFYDTLLTPAGMLALKCAMVISLLFSTLGYCTRIATKTSLLLVVFYQGLLRSIGHNNHDEMVAMYFLLILAFTPCGDGFSVDSLGRGFRFAASRMYGYPLLLMQLVMGFAYFSAGILKLAKSGMAYFGPDVLPILAIQHSLDNLHDTQFRVAFWLPAIRSIMPVIVATTVAWEILFPFATLFRKLRWWWLGVGVFFHVSTMLTMNIFFWAQFAMYAVFVDWPAVVRWLRKSSLIGRPFAWWHSVRQVSERFPSDVMAGDGVPREALLWDGSCGFCSDMVQRLHKFAKRPFKALPFQSVSSALPQDVMELTDKQMHWVHKDGRIVGGSTALIEVLAHSGHPLLAALFDSAILRPFTWLGYRLAARHRDRAGGACSIENRPQLAATTNGARGRILTRFEA